MLKLIILYFDAYLLLSGNKKNFADNTLIFLEQINSDFLCVKVFACIHSYEYSFALNGLVKL